MAQKTEAVIFDNDNTIARIYPNPKIYWSDVFVKTVEECGGSIPKGKEEEYMLSYFTNKGFMEKLETIGLKTTWAHFQKAKGVVDERERVEYIRSGHSKLFPDAVAFMHALNSRGIKYAVATFTTKKVVLEAFRQVSTLHQPHAFFDWNDSLKYKLEKPNPEIARIVLEKLNVKPERAIMVGDRLTDIQMGNRAGMRTVLVKRRDQDGDLVDQMEKDIEMARRDPEAYCQIPDLQVTDLTQIEKIL
ncbi:MAG: HAD family hydrolase [Candidatus Aureabacteria bacterium]|nr:HAD family hydrolase [Candidatus Auribacterota bacterium]